MADFEGLIGGGETSVGRSVILVSQKRTGKYESARNFGSFQWNVTVYKKIKLNIR